MDDKLPGNIGSHKSDLPFWHCEKENDAGGIQRAEVQRLYWFFREDLEAGGS